ncbi:MAG: hypothetical protein K6F34_06405 [Lachnospiraceae bacterium]|nr:hypothetical protein [Lachnospiraceae bacterium]
MKSIFEQLDETVKEHGFVPDGFGFLNALKPGEILPLYPGEKEGLMNHAKGLAPAEEVDRAFNVIRENVKINARLAVHNFDDNDLGFKVADIRGQLLKKIIDGIKEFDPHKLSTLAYSLVMFGEKIETVKLGLLILVLFDFADDEVIRKHLITIGMHEEFTGYVIANAKGWPPEIRNHVYYTYARKLKGWGKINAMEYIEPVNDEVRRWILCHGCENDISYGMLAITAYEKSSLKKRLKRGGLDNEEMQGARDIMRGLLMESGERSLAGIKEPEDFVDAYLKEQVSHSVGLEDLSNLLKIRSFFTAGEQGEDTEAALKLIERILSLSDAEEMIRGGLAEHPDIAVSAASDCGIDISDDLLALMMSDFDRYYIYAPYFMEEGRDLGDFVTICEDKIETKAVNKEAGSTSADVWELDTVIGYLKDRPGMGSKIILEGIVSENSICREAAADVMKSWEGALGRNIKKIDSDLFHAVKKARKKETDEELKKAWDLVVDYK